jgi:hypothetical protein
MRNINDTEVMAVGGGIPGSMGGNPFGAGSQSPATGAAQDSAGSFLAGYVVGLLGSLYEELSE